MYFPNTLTTLVLIKQLKRHQIFEECEKYMLLKKSTSRKKVYGNTQTYLKHTQLTYNTLKFQIKRTFKTFGITLS